MTTTTKRDPKITKQIRLIRKYIKQYAVDIRKTKNEFKESQRAYSKLMSHNVSVGWGTWIDPEGQGHHFWTCTPQADWKPQRKKDESDAAYEARVEAWKEYNETAPCAPHQPGYHWSNNDEPEAVTALHILLHELKGDGKKHLADESDEYEYSYFVDIWRQRIAEEAEAENAES